MKKTGLILSFLCCCLIVFGQKEICVDGSVGTSGNGSSSSPYKTIQAAINAASNGDIIKVAKGTYSEAVKIEQKKVQLQGGFAGSGNYGSANPQTNVTILNGTSTNPCIYIYIDKQVAGSMTISGFTIRNGKNGIELSGGWSGFLNNITIENNTIENNGSQNTNRGGGIFLEGKNVTVQKNTIRNNKSGRGAGIAASATDFLIADNLIEKNSCYDDHAGGVQVYGKGTVTRNIFDGNEVGAGPSVNFGWGWGGGILVSADDNIATTVTLSHNVYRNNTAPSRGAAVFVDDGAVVRMENELLYNNKTKSSGSAIYVDADYKNRPSTLNMFNCTVSGNSTSSNEAALFVQGSITTVESCIFWNNGKDFEFMRDGVSSANLTVTYTLTQQGYTGTGNITSDPLFANAATGDFHLKSTGGRYDPATKTFVKDAVSSPAIDAGRPGAPYANETAPNGGRVNMGCYGNTAEASRSGVTENEEIKQTSWTVFPNPAKERVTINHLPIGSRVALFSVTGQKMYNSVATTEQTTISTATFENGIYILQVSNNGAVTSKKIVINK